MAAAEAAQQAAAAAEIDPLLAWAPRLPATEPLPEAAPAPSTDPASVARAGAGASAESSPVAASATGSATASAPGLAAAPASSAGSMPSLAASPAPPSAPATPAFSWPPSTQLRYKLHGDYRGPVEGSASVEWVRQGQRYQVRMASSAGPLFSRQALSDGLLTDQGLQPQRFSAGQRILFSSQQWAMRFGPQWVELASGRSVPTLPGVQDEASQFVQLTWLFTTQPQRLRVGQSVQMPLAIGRRLVPWVFDVVAEELLQLPMGDVPTFHVKPRGQPAPGDMAAEMWFAPTLQYLPVRILIRQASGHWVDLTLAEAPLQAAEPAASR